MSDDFGLEGFIPNLPPDKDFDEVADMAWSARCDCYDYHSSASGRCTCRSDDGKGGHAKGVYDPTHKRGEVAICSDCRINCSWKKGEDYDSDHR